MDGARYLEDGRLTVFRRNGTCYARLRLSPGKYVTRSLKTTVEETAVQLGRRLLFQFEHRAEQGLPPRSKTFSAVIDDYIRFRERDHAHGKTSAGMMRQIRRVSKFWREYAGHLAIEDIDDKVMRGMLTQIKKIALGCLRVEWIRWSPYKERDPTRRCLTLSGASLLTTLFVQKIT